MVSPSVLRSRRLQVRILSGVLSDTLKNTVFSRSARSVSVTSPTAERPVPKPFLIFRYQESPERVFHATSKVRGTRLPLPDQRASCRHILREEFLSRRVRHATKPSQVSHLLAAYHAGGMTAPPSDETHHGEPPITVRQITGEFREHARERYATNPKRQPLPSQR